MGLFSRRAKALEKDLAAAQAANRDLASKLEATEAEHRRVVAERDELDRRGQELIGERDGAQAALGDERQRRQDAEAEVAKLRDQVEGGPSAVEDEAVGSREVEDGGDRGAPARAHPEADGCWALLLADVERRWAAGVGAPGEARGVHLGAVPDQLTEALTREVDRLREEVGVEIKLTADAAVDPADPVVFLLAAAHLLGVLAAGCQRVTVEVDGAVVLTGVGWSGGPEELELARERVLAAGSAVDPLDLEEAPRDPEEDPDAPDRERWQVQLRLRPQ